MHFSSEQVGWNSHKQPVVEFYSVQFATLVNLFLVLQRFLERYSTMATYVFLGNTDPQDTYLLFDGHELVITRSIRRIATAWRGHLAFYINFRCWSWNTKQGLVVNLVHKGTTKCFDCQWWSTS
jgi:hypothetical protein